MLLTAVETQAKLPWHSTLWGWQSPAASQMGASASSVCEAHEMGSGPQTLPGITGPQVPSAEASVFRHCEQDRHEPSQAESQQTPSIQCPCAHWPSTTQETPIP